MQHGIAVITTVYNEAVLLPLWLRYYGAQFGRAHLYVIDDGSTDGCADNLDGVNVIRIEREPIDENNRALAISLFHNALQKHYDAVIYTDVDEFLIVDPLLRLGLGDYIHKHAGMHTNALGFDLVHNHFVEPAYSADVPALHTRAYARFARPYCKPLIHKQDVMWTPGFHGTNGRTNLGVGLYLFHLRALDYELSRQRIRDRNQLAWSERSYTLRQGSHVRLDEEAYLRSFYAADPAVFDDALPADRFKEVAMRAANLMAQNATVASGAYQPLESRVLTIPARFRDSLPAVNAPWPSEMPPGPARLRAVEATEIFKASLDMARRGEITYVVRKGS